MTTFCYAMRATAMSLLIAVLPLAAQEAAPTAQMSRTRPLNVFPYSPDYPVGLAQRGVQGTAVVRANTTPEGLLVNAVIEESASSAELDAAALAIASKLKVKPGPARSLSIPVRFLRDTSTDLPRKTCTEFNADVSYYKTAFPQLRLTDMPVFELATGLLMAADSALVMAHLKDLGKAQAKTIAACAKSPKESFLATYSKSLRG